MTERSYKSLSKACGVAGNLALAGSLAVWLAARMGRDQLQMADGLFLGVLGGGLLALGNRLALAAIDRAETARWRGEEGNDVGSAHLFRDAEEREVLAEPDVPIQSPRPLSHVRHGAHL